MKRKEFIFNTSLTLPRPRTQSTPHSQHTIHTTLTTHNPHHTHNTQHTPHSQHTIHTTLTTHNPHHTHNTHCTHNKSHIISRSTPPHPIPSLQFSIWISPSSTHLSSLFLTYYILLRQIIICYTVLTHSKSQEHSPETERADNIVTASLGLDRCEREGLQVGEQ